ncbi:hypothetical protein VTO42DRAFT_6071 [Malbranchea cinnamomea]
MGSADFCLPAATSSDLVLVNPTPEERLECLRINGTSWRGPLDIDQYIQRENLLMQQEMTKDGALTFWILVDRNLPPNSRTILSSCETFAKRAFLAHNGKVEDVIAHTVGSVFCRPEFRGRGYAKRMIAELAKVLETWQQEKSARKKTIFSTLYSDIGKGFYAAHGWKPFPSSHISLPPISRADAQKGRLRHDLALVRDMDAGDAKRQLCSDAVIERYRAILRDASLADGRAKVAIVPDFAHMSWHWAREEFYAGILCPEKGTPRVKGAGVPSRRVFLCWNRKFDSNVKGNTLYILRTLYEKPVSPAERQGVLEGLAVALRRAQVEAYEWGMHHVEIWNPSDILQEAARLLNGKVEVVHRESYGVPSLKWGGKEFGLGEDVDWCWNERYAWC